MKTDGLSINLGTVRQQFDLKGAIEACVKLGITAISPWRDHVQSIGVAEATRIIKSNGIKLTGYCRGGLFAALDEAGRQAAIDDNRKMIDEAAAIGADCIVMIGGGIPKGSRDIKAARQMFADGMAAILPHARAAKVPLAIEALHPMYAADRGCISTLAEALDLCDALGKGVGVAIDVYHLWWDPDLARQIERARSRVLAHHICDWLVPTKDLLLDRGMMGDGVIDLPGIRRMVEDAGFHGHQEVEIFSAENWWKRPGDEVLRTCVERYNTVC
jgi:sugar phosphate isomerase/epimerase